MPAQKAAYVYVGASQIAAAFAGAPLDRLAQLPATLVPLRDFPLREAHATTCVLKSLPARNSSS